MNCAAAAPLWLLCCGLYGLTPTAAASPAAIERVIAAVPSPEHGKVLYLKHCPACHGPHAWGDGPRAIPALAGQHDRYLIEQLTDFATATRGGDSMHEVMRHADVNWPQAVRDLSAFLSQAPRNRTPELGEHAGRNAGRALYLQACSTCHGTNGAGEENGAPAIGGQQYRYLLVRMRNFSSTHHETVQSPFAASDASGQQLENVANFISRLSALTAASDPTVNGR